MKERIEKIKEFAREASIKREDEPQKEHLQVKQKGLLNLNGNTNCNIYYNRRAEDRQADGPYMTDCPNCTRRVSRQAQKCPGCGHPVSLHFRKIGLQRAAKGLVVSLVAIITGAIILKTVFGITATPFLSIAALVNMFSLAAVAKALDQIPPGV